MLGQKMEHRKRTPLYENMHKGILPEKDPNSLPKTRILSVKKIRLPRSVLGTTFFCFKFKYKNGAKVLKNHKILEWCEGKNVKLEKL